MCYSRKSLFDISFKMSVVQIWNGGEIFILEKAVKVVCSKICATKGLLVKYFWQHWILQNLKLARYAVRRDIPLQLDTASGKINVSPFTFRSIFIKLRENMLKNKKSGLYRLSVISVLFIGTFTLIQSRAFKSIVPNNQGLIEDPSTRMDRKHEILKRGCSMVKSLFDMSQNGTSVVL